jgi:site-specific recombinase XerD
MSGTRRKPGSMGPFIDGFRVRLFELGYTPGTVRQLLKDVGQLGRWMAAEGVEVSQLSEASIEVFRQGRRADGYQRVSSARSFRPLLSYLRHEKVVAGAASMPWTPVEALVGDYREWLVRERGLAAMTVLRYENLARRFLEERFAAAGDCFVSGLVAPDVTAFLLRETARVSVGAAKGRVAELRSLLRFLYLKGWTPAALATAVPPVAGWHDVGLPRGVAAGDVERLLACCDQSSAAGVRDFAILMLVARLGLRSIEVARLELGDIDWRAGVIEVRGKARRRDRLPLPGAVGEALSAYLCQGRPATSIRQVFLATKAPTRAIRADLVSDVTRRACERAGVARVGAHRLRHALATEMLRRGATLVEVSQILRHRDLATTAIYAKVDLVSLRQVAQRWPGDAQ